MFIWFTGCMHGVNRSDFYRIVKSVFVKPRTNYIIINNTRTPVYLQYMYYYVLYLIIYSLQQIDFIYIGTPKDAKHNDYNRVNNINMCSCFFVYKNRSSIRVLALVF